MTAASLLAVADNTSTTCRCWRHAYLAVMSSVTVLYFVLPDAPRYLRAATGCPLEEEIEQLCSVLHELAARFKLRSAA